MCDILPEIESDSEEFTYHPDIDSDFDKDVELGDDILEFSTLIFPEVIPVITELVDVFLKDIYT